MTSLSAKQLISSLDSLASFPDVALKIDAALQAENSSSDTIASLIEKDPAVSAALLRIANSAAFGRSGQIDSISTAIKVVGTKQVRDLTYAICAATSFDRIPNDLISVEDFWRHSLFCGVAAENLAKQTKGMRGQPSFTAGLLHDIGHLVMFSQAPDQSRQALQRALDFNSVHAVAMAEREVFGFDHTHVGALLAENWQFPDNIRNAIAGHHDDANSTETRDLVTLIHAANGIAVLMELNGAEDVSAIDSHTLATLQIDETTLLDIASQSIEASEELLEIFVN